MPTPRSFIDFLRDQRGGLAADELAEKLNELVAVVATTNKKGRLVFTLTVEPVKKSGQVTVSDRVDLKLPDVDRGGDTIYFITPENNLSRRDPRQADLPGIKEVVASQPVPKAVGEAT